MSTPTALIVDDETHARLYVRLLLKEVGITECWEATDAGEAWTLFNAHRPGLVVLDMNLRGSTGTDVLAQIRATDADVPIVFLTAENTTRTVATAARLGADAYLLKHGSREDALATLRELLSEPDEAAGE